MDAPSDTFHIDELLSHREYLERLALRLAQDGDSAGDLVQETWVTALVRAPKRGRSARPWLSTVMRNLHLNRKRSELHERQRLQRAQPGPTHESVEERAQRNELTLRFAAAIAALPVQQRVALRMHLFEGATPNEIAARLAIPLETARTRIKRGLAQVRARLDAEYGRRSAWSSILLLRLRAPDASLRFGRTRGLPLRKLCMSAGLIALPFVARLASREVDLAHAAEPELAVSPAAAQAEPRAADDSNERLEVASSATSRPAVLSLHAVWNDDGSPAAEVTFDLEQVLAPSGSSRRLTTSLDGTLEVADLEPGRWRVAPSLGAPQTADLRDTGQVRLDFELPRGLPVVGNVVSHAGEPLAEAEIWVSWPRAPEHAFLAVRSDPGGRFALPAVDPQSWIGARRAGTIESELALVAAAPLDGRGRRVRLSLALNTVALEARVVDSLGRPVAGARVRAERSIPPFHDEEGSWWTQIHGESVESDLGGRFAVVDAPRMPMPITVEAEGFARRTATLSNALTHTERVIELEPEARIRGRVTTIEGTPAPSGVPVERVESGRTRLVALTCDDGSFELAGLPAGKVELRVGVGDGRPGCARASAEVASGSTTELAIQLADAPSVRGVVLDRSGAAAVGWTVTLEAQAAAAKDDSDLLFERKSVRRTRTDRAGRFEFEDCDALPHVVRALPSERVDELARATALDVEPGGEPLVLRADAEPPAIVSGRLARSSPRDCVLLHSAALPVAARAELDSSGAFAFPSLPAGFYQLGFLPHGGDITVIASLELAPGERRDLGCIERAASTSLTVAVRREDGEPAPEFDLRLRSIDGRRIDDARARASSSDRRVFSDLRAGTYWLGVRAPGMVDVLRQIRVGRGEEETIEVVLRPGLSVRLELELPDDFGTNGGGIAWLSGPDLDRRPLALRRVDTPAGSRWRWNGRLRQDEYRLEVATLSGWERRSTLQVESRDASDSARLLLRLR